MANQSSAELGTFYERTHEMGKDKTNETTAAHNRDVCSMGAILVATLDTI